MAKQPELGARITGDASGLLKANKKAQKSLAKLSKTGEGVGKKLAAGFKLAAVAAAAAATAVAGATAAIALKSIGLAREQIRVEKQLAAVLKSTKNAAGLNADELKRMASQLQKVTNFGDEAIIGGQNLLLTFTQIGRDVFPAATEIMLDMSAALGTDLKGSALQLGKALNDPIKGVTALTRVGVSFTEQQKAQITAMQNAGRTADAQRIILAELQTQFGGTARALAEPWIQVQNALGDVGEEIGKALIPTINQLSVRLIPIIERLGRQITAIAKVAGPALVTFFENATKGGDGLASVITDIGMGFEKAAQILQTASGPMAAVFTTLNAGVGILAVGIGTVSLALTGIVKVAADANVQLFKGIEAIIPQLARLVAISDAVRGTDSTQLIADILGFGVEVGNVTERLKGLSSEAGATFNKIEVRLKQSIEDVKMWDQTYVDTLKSIRDVAEGMDSLGKKAKTAADAAAGIAPAVKEASEATKQLVREEIRARNALVSISQEVTRGQAEAARELAAMGIQVQAVGAALSETDIAARQAAGGIREVGNSAEDMRRKLDGARAALLRLNAVANAAKAQASASQITQVGGSGSSGGGFIKGEFVVTSNGLRPVNANGEIDFNARPERVSASTINNNNAININVSATGNARDDARASVNELIRALSRLDPAGAGTA